jgi:phospholipid/cholesterol/gamma-HCH transport system substrate-binding protein
MLRTKLLGVVFLALVVLAGYLTYGVFTQKFTDYDRVTLQASKIGLQLPRRADVKIRGVIVGEVLDVRSDTDGAEVELGLFPDKREIVPAGVTGSIVPKTLFGEKYVSLVVPEDASGSEPIEAGATIRRTELPTEVEEVLSDLYPLLRTVAPADLNLTLTAIATALEGRGDRIGANLETVDDYLQRLNPQIPRLVEDLRLTAQVADTYDAILPEVGQILEDSITTTSTLEDRQQDLAALFDDVSSFSDTARTFLADNEQNLIRLGEVSEPVVGLLAEFAPYYPCLLKGIVGAGKLQAEAFRGYTLHIVLETLPNQPRPYDADDQPRFGEQRGGTCLHLPNPGSSQENPLRRQPDLDDGVDEPTGKGTQRVTPGFAADPAYVGTSAEAGVLRSLLADGTGRTADEVGDLDVLLLGPMARGAEVSLR